MIEIEKECTFGGITADDPLVSTVLTAITDTKLRENLLKEKQLKLTKTIEMIEQIRPIRIKHISN